MTTQQVIKKRTSLCVLFTLLASLQLSGCFVSVPDSDRYDDEYHDHYHDEYHDHFHEDEAIFDEYEEFEEQESFEEFEEQESFEEFEEEVTTTTTTTTTTHDEPDQITPQHPKELLFEDTFEQPSFSGVDRIHVMSLNQWAIEWSSGSECERFEGAASVEIQRGADLGAQGEVEGEQHLRLEGICGTAQGATQILTSLAEVQDATTLTFYARAAEGVLNAELQVKWNQVSVMDEALLSEWAEYTIDLTQVDSHSEAILSLTALTSGVLIDHIRVK